MQIKLNLSLVVEIRPPYWHDIIGEIFELQPPTRDFQHLARAFELTTLSILGGIARADKKERPQADAPPGSGAVYCDEWSRPRCENERVWEERDILSKAAPWFGRETETLPSNSSAS